MNSYRYRVTVERVAGQRGEAVDGAEPGHSLTFEVANHDDVIAIAQRVRERWPYPADESSAMAVGLKLLAEVALTHRNDALFAELRPALREFAAKMKKGPDPASGE